MKTKHLTKIILSVWLTGMMGSAQAQFTAVNDQTQGPTTSPNATTYGAFGTGSQVSGPLKNINTGTDLTVNLSIATAGPVASDVTGEAPDLGTPLDIEFSSFLDWNGSLGTNNVLMRSGGSVTYTITGLDPAKTYVIMGGAVKGLEGIADDRYTIFSLTGADSFAAGHSAGALTSADAPGDIPANGVAINTGDNREGLMARWNDVRAGADGTVQVVSEKYDGAVPGGSSGGRFAYALTAFKIIDAEPAAVQILSEPVNQLVPAGEPATFSVAVNGFPIEYQWFKNGSPIPGANGPTYTIPSVELADSGGFYSVTVDNEFGPSQTSDTALLTVELSESVVFIPWDHPWLYEITATDLGTDWKNVDFVPGPSWLGPSPGPLGDEGSTINPPIATPFNKGTELTHYFRTEFVFDGLPSATTLLITNFIDDGAVFWLNGVEVYRVGMNAGTATFNTLSGRVVGNAAQELLPLDQTVAVIAELQTGTNVLAVETHQQAATSSDIVFGTSWAAEFPGPTELTITRQPEPQVVEQLKTTELTVEVDGNGASYLWFKDGVAVPGSNSPRFRIPSTQLDDAGDYTVEVRNHISRIISQPALLTVLVDTNGPTLVQADGSLTQTNITVTFSEKISPTQAEDTANYRLTTTGGGTFNISSATLTNATNVILITEARVPGTNYLVVVNDIQDISPQANAIAPDSRVPVSTLIELIRGNSPWTFYNPFPPFDPADPGAGWELPGFDDSFWGMGGSLFYISTDPQVSEYAIPLGTSIDQGNITSFYRTTFDFNASPLGAVFNMQYIAVDGAVFYLNGTEFFRTDNIPPGPVDFDDPVLFGGPFTLESVDDIPTDLLVVGENLMAVELHGETTADESRSFGMIFDIKVNSVAEGPVFITQQPRDQTVLEGQPAIIGFNGAGPNMFQWLLNGSPIPGANGPTLHIPRATLAMDGNVYSVTASNETSGAASESAVLTVLADTVPPKVVSAITDANSTSVTVSFSEPIDPATGNSIGNYVITNASGFVSIFSATVTDETNVVLNTGPAALSGSVVVINRVTDTSQAKNPIAPNSAVIIGFEGMVFDWLSPWRFDQTTGLTEDPPAEWNQLIFDDSFYQTGPGIYGNEGNLLPPNANPLPDIMTEMLSTGAGGPRAIYLRKVFTLPVPVAAADSFELDSIYDDGVVVFLNGEELLRKGVAPNQNSTTLAASHEANEIDTDIILSGFVDGNNILAVELHQTSDGSSDAVWGAQLRVSASSKVLPPPPAACGPLSIVLLPSGMVEITWDSSTGCVLQQTDALAENPADTVWSPVVGATSPHRVSPTSAKFYRLSSN